MNATNRARQRGFSFIEILVVMGIISVLVSMVVVVVPRIQEESRRTKSKDNLRNIYMFMQVKVNTKGWKYFNYSGKNFTLSPIAHGEVNRTKKANLDIFFAPGDAILSIEGLELERYKSVTPDALKRGNEGFEDLTSYAGRRNAEREYKITPAKEDEGTLILADDDDGPVHHKAGFVAAYSNGRVVFHEWGDFDMAEPDDPDNPDRWLGDEAKNDDLAALSSE